VGEIKLRNNGDRTLTSKILEIMFWYGCDTWEIVGGLNYVFEIPREKINSDSVRRIKNRILDIPTFFVNKGGYLFKRASSKR